MYLALPSKASKEVAETLFMFWCAIAGPPEFMISDMGGEFQKELTTLAEVWGCRPKVGPAEAPWQNALAERHGAVLGDVARMAIGDAGASYASMPRHA